MEKQLAICKECGTESWTPVMNKDKTEQLESQAFLGSKFYECTNCGYVELYNDEYEIKLQAPVIKMKAVIPEKYYHTQIVEFLNELEYSLMDPGLEISDDDKTELEFIQHVMGQYIGKIPADEMSDEDLDYEMGIHPDDFEDDDLDPAGGRGLNSHE